MARCARILRMKDLLSLHGKNILGVNPPVHDFAFYDLWSKPIGLLYLLQKAREGGCDVRLIDCVRDGAEGQMTFGREKIAKTEIRKPDAYRHIKRKYHHFGIGEEAFSQRLRNVPKPDTVFITSAMTYWYGGVRWAIEKLRAELPGVPLVLGGIYARLCFEHASSLGADFIVAENWEPDAAYPAMDLYGHPPYGVVMTSFGCPMRCDYCASGILWPRFKRRTVEEVMKEIDFQANLGVIDFAFYDDALLLGKREYFYPLCRKLKARYNGALRFHAPNGLHVREIDGECAALLKETGFKTIRLSLESVDPSVAQESSGKVLRGEYAAAVKCCREAGWRREECETYILLGLPGQSLGSVAETIDFVKACGGKPKLAEFSPIPGTKSFDAAAKEIPEITVEPLLHNNSVYSSWISGALAPNELQELKDRARRP